MMVTETLAVSKFEADEMFGFDGHELLPREREWWRLVEKLYRLSFSPNEHEAALAFRNFESMLNNNPWDYLYPPLNVAHPGIWNNYYKKVPKNHKLAKRIKVIEIKKFTDAGTKNEKSQQLIDLLAFCGLLDSYLDESESKLKKCWLTYWDMIGFIPGFKKKKHLHEIDKFPLSNVQRALSEDIYHRITLLKDYPRRYFPGAVKTAEGWPGVVAYIMPQATRNMVPVKDGDKPLALAYQIRDMRQDDDYHHYPILETV